MRIIYQISVAAEVKHVHFYDEYVHFLVCGILSSNSSVVEY
jgi:hypothetical protein